MTTNQRRRKIGVFSQGGLKNLGDEVLFAAVLQNVRARIPDAEIIGFTVNPEDTNQRHGIPAFPVCRLDTVANAGSSAMAFPVPHNASETPTSVWKQRIKAIPGLVTTVRGIRRLIHVAREVILEPRFLWQSYQRLRGVELLLVAGSQQLNDIYGAWAFPVTLYKWSLLSRFTGTKFVMLSVGAGPITSPLSRFFIRSALRRCSYRSYRDAISRELVESIGIKGSNPVFPDLAYSLKLPSPRAIPAEGGRDMVVGINPVPFYDGRYWATSNPGRYAEYVEKFARFTEWLSQKNYSTLFFPTQLRADALTIEDIRSVLAGNGGAGRLLEGGFIQTLDDLVTEISRADIVIANRYHGILIALALNKPVIGVAYHEKSRALLEQVGQGEYVLDVSNFRTEDLIEKITALHANALQSKEEIARRIAPLCEALERQYDMVFALIGIASPDPASSAYHSAELAPSDVEPARQSI
jgi:polysaccharide pyruvyl transferase WcaK-like protein